MDDFFWEEETETEDRGQALCWLSAYRQQAAYAERLLLGNPEFGATIQCQLDYYLSRLEYWLLRVDEIESKAAPTAAPAASA